MPAGTLELKVKVVAEISLWTAIKLRIAGKYIDKATRNTLDAATKVETNV